MIVLVGEDEGVGVCPIRVDSARRFGPAYDDKLTGRMSPIGNSRVKRRAGSFKRVLTTKTLTDANPFPI